MDRNLLNIREDVIIDYQNNQAIIQILNKYHINWSQFYNLVAPCLRHNKNDVSSQEIIQIIKLYHDKYSTTKIGIQLGIHHKIISEILKENEIMVKSAISSRKYDLNEYYFDKIDTPNKAYILGLFYADGYNSVNKGALRLSLNVEDEDILLKICKELNYSKPLSVIKCSNKVASNGYVSKDMCTLDIYSRYMSNVLLNYGLFQNKSLILSFPTLCNEKFYSHFLRGYFDGDGSYCHRYSNKYGWRDVITFTSTDNFCQRAKEIINHYSNAIGGGIYDASCHNGITKVLVFSGAKQTKKLLDWLYEDAELFLERKHQLYLEVS